MTYNVLVETLNPTHTQCTAICRVLKSQDNLVEQLAVWIQYIELY